MCLCAFVHMCVNALVALYCVMLCGLYVVVFVCSLNVLMCFVLDFLYDVLWVAFVLCFCG